MQTTPSRRRFKLRIWWLALGYFAFYTPYSFSTKFLTSQLWPGIDHQISGFRLLPAVAISTALVLLAIIIFKGWWSYVSCREFRGRKVPIPPPLIILSGIGTAIIIGATTLTFTFTGISILFALLLMRGGVLIMAPSVDVLFRRRVRWFSWVALGITLPAMAIALLDANNYRLTEVAALTICAYLSGYLLRLPCLTRLAKLEDNEITRRYFVEESSVAVLFLVAIPAAFALIGQGEIMLQLRQGFVELFTSNLTLPAMLIGALYAGLYCFGTLIYLDCRENTFCIPLNRGSSLLAGIVASYVLAVFFGQEVPSPAQLAGAGLIVLALLVLSPLHHADRYWLKLKNAFTPKPVPVLQPERLFLFVCSGNTCRSPMAAAMANAEIAQRLRIPFESLETVNVRALSAGVSARAGAPLTAEAAEVLRSLDVPVQPHAARNLTAELAEKAEMIFCLTSAHRQAVIEMLPSVAGKTYCLDLNGDVEDPIGKGMPAYVACARRIQAAVRLRFDEIGLAV
jgi:protein-tyrosine-phosphatase/drug/metabolite transporter (DMT)-like permease